MLWSGRIHHEVLPFNRCDEPFVELGLLSLQERAVLKISLGHAVLDRHDVLAPEVLVLPDVPGKVPAGA
jgi:hypothetical protein